MTNGREERPSAKKSLRRKGFSRGWSCISWRQPASTAQPAAMVMLHRRRSIRIGSGFRRCGRRLIGHLRNLLGMQGQQKTVGLLRVEFGISRFDDQEKPVARGTSEPGNVEQRMIG